MPQTGIPDIDMLLDGDPVAIAKARANALRGQQAVALLGQLSGDKVLSPVGQQLNQNVAQQQQGMGTALLQRMQMQRQAQQQQAQASRQGLQDQLAQAKLAETMRHNLATESGAGRSGAATPSRIVTGQGGVQYRVDPRSSAPAQPVLGPDGKPIVKPRQERPIPPAEKNTLQQMTGEYRALDDLSQRFQPAFAGGGPLGSAATAAYQTLGSWASKDAQKDAAFWSDFQRLVDLPQRNAIFGASLTVNEKESWERAKNVNPRTNPELVKTTLESMKGILGRKIKEHADALRFENFNADAVQSLTGGVAGPSEPAAGGVRKFTRVNGKLVEVK